LLEALDRRTDGRASVRLAHEVVGFEQDGCGVRVDVVAGRGEGARRFQVQGDFLVAADGSMSNTRAKFVPGEPRRWAAP
jgi:2-polyprenyl-6-methoxyphenol hydroxylase-like FAD-dependent oxidoreductase